MIKMARDIDKFGNKECWKTFHIYFFALIFPINKEICPFIYTIYFILKQLTYQNKNLNKLSYLLGRMFELSFRDNKPIDLLWMIWIFY